MCPSGHRKHPLQRFDRSGAGHPLRPWISPCRMRGLSFGNPRRGHFSTTFPFARSDRRASVFHCFGGRVRRDEPRGRVGRRHRPHAAKIRSLDAVYAQDWANIENFLPSRPPRGVELKRWEEQLGGEHSRRAELGIAWRRLELPDDAPFHPTETTRLTSRGMAFLDGHGTIEDWGCGFSRARVRDPQPTTLASTEARQYADRSSICVLSIGTRTASSCATYWNTTSNGGEFCADALESFRTAWSSSSSRRSETGRGSCRRDGLHVCGRPGHFVPEGRPDRTSGHTRIVTEESLETDTQYRTEHVFYISK